MLLRVDHLLQAQRVVGVSPNPLRCVTSLTRDVTAGAKRRTLPRDYEFSEVYNNTVQRMAGKKYLPVVETQQMIECIKTPDHAHRCLDLLQRYLAEKERWDMADDLDDDQALLQLVREGSMASPAKPQGQLSMTPTRPAHMRPASLFAQSDFTKEELEDAEYMEEVMSSARAASPGPGPRSSPGPPPNLRSSPGPPSLGQLGAFRPEGSPPPPPPFGPPPPGALPGQWPPLRPAPPGQLPGSFSGALTPVSGSPFPGTAPAAAAAAAAQQQQ
ncbi:hypothetical protein V8C86DRAFT_405239 [Haematococcus lacustris]